MEENMILIDEMSIKDRIYTIRGVKVMLDFDLAEIYGYSTKAFNQQVYRNSDKFDDDFRFQLTKEETDILVRSQLVTSRADNLFKGQSGGRRYLPYAFTEQGIYMLITIISDNLRGMLHMSDYLDCIRENPDFKVNLIRSMGVSHDRFIMLDHRTDNERLFLSGPSSKDSGNRMSSILEFRSKEIVSLFSDKLSELLKNPPLQLH